jgi:hypothetical protein
MYLRWRPQHIRRSIGVLLVGIGAGGVLALFARAQGAPAIAAWGVVAALPFVLAALTGVAKTTTA